MPRAPAPDMRQRVELALLARDPEDEGGLGRLAQRRVGGQRVDGVGVVDEVQPARDGGLADAHGRLRVAQRLGEVGDHGHLRLALQVIAQVVEESARQADVEARLARDHGGQHGVGAVEAGDLLRRGCRRRGDLQRARAGIDLEACQLAVEGVEVGRGRLVVLLRLGLVAERLVRAAEPVLAARMAQRAVGGLGQRLEVAERQLGVVQMAQRQPAGEEGGVLGWR